MKYLRLAILPSTPPLTPSKRIVPSGTLPTYKGCRFARSAPVLVRWQSRAPLKYNRSLLCSLISPTCVHVLASMGSLEVRRSHKFPMLGTPKHTCQPEGNKAYQATNNQFGWRCEKQSESLLLLARKKTYRRHKEIHAGSMDGRGWQGVSSIGGGKYS